MTTHHIVLMTNGTAPADNCSQRRRSFSGSATNSAATGAVCPGSESTSTMSSRDRRASRRSRICSRAAASSSSTTSCSRPDWEAGCKWLLLLGGQFQRHRCASESARRDAGSHLARAARQSCRRSRERMGWTFKWVSSARSDFNYDYQVSFKPEDLAHGTSVYNYARHEGKMTDMPGFSVFLKDGAGGIFHTYSTYARGLDPMNVAYQLLDIAPKGRDEAGLAHPMSWVRLHDRYGTCESAQGVRDELRRYLRANAEPSAAKSATYAANARPPGRGRAPGSHRLRIPDPGRTGAAVGAVRCA